MLQYSLSYHLTRGCLIFPLSFLLSMNPGANGENYIFLDSKENGRQPTSSMYQLAACVQALFQLSILHLEQINQVMSIDGDFVTTIR